jgi:hypothetical protein
VRCTLLTQPERLPDLLRERVGTYFETDGLCFAPQIETTADGAARMAVYYQNRYTGRATATIRVLPPRRAWLLSRHDLPAPAFTFTCPGGAFGVTRAPFAIPHAYQGQRITFSIRAHVRFAEGRGELLRFRAGQHVRSTRVTLELPQGVRESGAGDADAGETQLIWWPDLLERAQREPAFHQHRAAA